MLISRRYESNAKRRDPVDAAKPSVEISFSPRFRIVFIIPGIESFAPERTDTRSGLLLSPNFLPVNCSSSLMFLATSPISAGGSLPPASLYFLQVSVVIVNPGGTGSPMLVISARFAPLPPSKSFILTLPSVFPLPKK